jgi:hypothetical protein
VGQVDQGGARLGVGDVGHVGWPPARRSGRARRRWPAFFRAGGQHHVGPVAQGAGGTLAAEAPAHAGHQHGLSFEDHPPLLDDSATTRLSTPSRRVGLVAPPVTPRGWPDPAAACGPRLHPGAGRVHAGQVVPRALGAHLDHVTDHRLLTPPVAGQLGLGGHAPPPGRASRDPKTKVTSTRSDSSQMGHCFTRRRGPGCWPPAGARGVRHRHPAATDDPSGTRGRRHCGQAGTRHAPLRETSALHRALRVGSSRSQGNPSSLPATPLDTGFPVGWRCARSWWVCRGGPSRGAPGSWWLCRGPTGWVRPGPADRPPPAPRPAPRRPTGSQTKGRRMYCIDISK